jgi:hypothetical protein
MRIVGDLGSLITGSPVLIQAEKTPAVGALTPINGKYVVPVDFGQIKIDTNSYVLPVDGGDVTSQAYANLLAQFPMFEYIYFNPLLTDDHVGELDLTGSYNDGTDVFPTRVQTGRDAGGADDGLAPLSTAVLPANTAVTPTRPGVLVTNTVDISAQTGGVGTDFFVVYWKIYEIENTQDIRSDYGALAGTNSPAIRSIKEIEQEPADFKVFISPDPTGDSWSQVGWLEPVGFCKKITEFSLLFVNENTTTKRYIASYAVMF